MNFRKIMALLVAVVILTSVFVMPTSASTTEEKFKKYIINDQFNTDGDTQGWAKGRVKSNTQTFNVTQGTAPDGSGALIFTSDGDRSVADGGNEPNIFKEFTKISLADGKPVVIKARFMQAGNGASTPAGISYLRFNQPNNENLLSSNNIPYGYPNMTTTINNANAVCDWFTLLKMDASSLYYRQYNSTWAPTSMASINTIGKWIDATITINSNTSVSISATIDSSTYSKTDGSLVYNGRGPLISYTLYNNPTATTALTEYPSLDSLTWVSQTKNTIYVDYVQVYQEVDYTDATVAITSGTTNIRANDPIVIQFTADTDVPSIPKEAFEIVGVETDFAYNSATKTVTLTQKEALEPGGQYTLNINKELIKSASGIIVTNDVSYTLEVCDISVSNLTPVKEIADGQKTVTATYTYASSKEAGEHTYQWQESTTGEEGTFTDIVGATSPTYTYTVSGTDKYIRFKMIPYDIEGNPGYETISSVLAPEMAPVASNVTLSTDLIFEGVYVTATYNFDDVNGDDEGASIIKWLTADSADSTTWTEVNIGDIYLVKGNDVGKFIKCGVTPVSKSEILSQGATEYSVPCQVVDILVQTNMYKDSGFESGTIEAPWLYSNNWNGADIQSKDVHSGSYALHLAPRTALNDHFGQKLSFSKDKTYVFGAYGKKSRARAQDVKDMTVFAGGDTLQVSVGTSNYVLNDRWKLMSFAYKFVADCSPNSGFVTWTDIDTADVYLDDFYCGPLLVGDIETYAVEPITIPQSGEISIPVTSGKALNQLGKNDGLQNEAVVVSIPDVGGVYVDGNKIVVTEQAYATEFTAKVYCEPQYFGATQDIFQKYIKIKLVAHDDPSPKALNVNATGVVATDSVLTGSYDFYQIEQKADNSEYKWVYSDKEDGVYKDISGATGINYTVTSGYADKYIKFVVMPKTDDLIEGEAAYSNALVAPKKPVAANVKITGDIAAGLTVNGEYEFTDANNDVEGTSTYRWLISDTEQGNYSPISGQTTDTLTLTEAMQGKYIKFEVTPVSLVDLVNGTQMEIDAAVGQVVTSNAVLGPVPPQALNVSMSKDGYRLKGMYTYNHPHYIPEKGTIYEWRVDGVLVATTPDYVVAFNGTKNVSFSVTPCAEDEPSRGKTVTVSVQITGYADNAGSSGGGYSGGGGGGGFSGGGGGSGTGVGVTNVNDMKIPEVEVQKPQEEQKPVSDITGHWGETYINNMVERGVMSADESGNHKPDENVSREIMLTYLFKALGLETTEYKNEFTDIENGEFASMLQTMVDNGTIAKDTAFRPNDTISREEMCKILYVSLKNANKLVETDEMVIEAFADYNNIAEWARVYVNGIYANKIMVGVSDTEFDAKGTVTKAQAATMLVRILALTEEAK